MNTAEFVRIWVKYNLISLLVMIPVSMAATAVMSIAAPGEMSIFFDVWLALCVTITPILARQVVVSSHEGERRTVNDEDRARYEEMRAEHDELKARVRARLDKHFD